MQTTSKHEELLNIQNSTDTDNKQSSHLMINDPIENTPFRLVGHTEKGWFIAMGNTRLTEFHFTKEEALEYLHDRHKVWDLMLTMMITVADAAIKTQTK